MGAGEVQIDWCVFVIWLEEDLACFQFQVLAPSCVSIPPGSCGDIVEYCVTELIRLSSFGHTMMSGPGS